LIKKGASREEAFNKATAELGDISEIADQLSHEKRKEVFGEMYISTKNYLDKRHIIGYVLAGGLLALGIVVALIAYFASGEIIAGFGSGMVLIVAPICGFVFLGLTQETAANYSMNWKRALIYTAAAALILFGVAVLGMMFFQVMANETYGMDELVPVIGSILPFALPGSVILAYLLLTEKSRHKPWVVEQQAIWAERMKEPFANPHAATRFGLYSGALWVLAMAMFAALGFVIGFQYSWLVFLFAVAAQILILAFMTPKNN